MPSTHLSLHYHLVFSTKDRMPIIREDWMEKLHSYIGGAIRELDGVAQQIGGTKDHIHILAAFPATISLSKAVQEIKQSSSRWVHETVRDASFGWQPGYGAFTVSRSNVEVVKTYIQNQPEHHRVKSFQEEYVAFLKKNGVEYDEKYLW